MTVRERRTGVFEGVTRAVSSSGISLRITVLGKLTMVVFIVLAAEAFSATSLNAEGNALLDFKNAITSDPQHAFQNWNNSDVDPCLWDGISCITIQGITPEERVVEINLSRNALGGTISPRLGDLVYLEKVNLDTNKLTGQIPRELFKALNLTRLSLSNNGFTGQLPEDIVHCHRLQRLDLRNNNITGVFPTGMGSNLTQLERLDFSVNHFNGPIPDDFGNLATLQGTLNLSNNHLSGSIPQSLANLRKLLIDFSNNNFSGPIPPDSYFQSLGAPAFVGNAALCGLPLKVDCAPSPSPSASFSATGFDISSKRALSKGAVIGIAVGCGAAGLLMATLVVYFFIRKLAIGKKSSNLQSPSRSENGLRGCLCSWRESARGSVSGEDEDEGDLVHLTGVLSFTLEELLRASAYVLGKSGVGIVYKAVLDEGTVVAVRRLGAGGEQRHKEFEAEVKTIAQVRHPNVVCLHSYSWTVDEKLLIYDYLSNGSLETALHGRSEGSRGPLTWEARLRIARGVSQGIAHIHECSPRKHIHGDIKPGNILLDAFLEPRIADFGLQRLLAVAEPEPVKEFGSARSDTGARSPAPAPAPASVALPEYGRRSSSPRGAHMVAPFLMGVYQAPEAINAKKLTQKSDVYSFGVVLLELLTGRSPFKQLAGGEPDLVSWIRVALQEKKTLSEVFDPYLLKGNNAQSKMIETLQVALACIAVNPDSRPKMKQVAEFFELQASS